MILYSQLSLCLCRCTTGSWIGLCSRMRQSLSALQYFSICSFLHCSCPCRMHLLFYSRSTTLKDHIQSMNSLLFLTCRKNNKRCFRNFQLCRTAQMGFHPGRCNLFYLCITACCHSLRNSGLKSMQALMV